MLLCVRRITNLAPIGVVLDVAVSGPGADCVRLAASDVYVLPQETAPLAVSFNPSRSGTFEGAIEFRFAV